MLSEIMQSYNIRMLQRSDRSGFSAEPLTVLRSGEFRGPEQLKGDDPIDATLARAPDNGHPAPSNFLKQLVVTETAERWIRGAQIVAGRGVARSV
jgi:hypothetical protein